MPISAPSAKNSVSTDFKDGASQRRPFSNDFDGNCTGFSNDFSSNSTGFSSAPRGGVVPDDADDDSDSESSAEDQGEDTKPKKRQKLYRSPVEDEEELSELIQGLDKVGGAAGVFAAGVCGRSGGTTGRTGYDS